MSHTESREHEQIYDQLAGREEFKQLRHNYRAFVIPACAVFIAWYGLYVTMSMFAPSFMNHVLVGKINVALVFGLLQFVTTFLIAWLYSRYSNAKLDPLSSQLVAEFEAYRAGAGTTGGAHSRTDVDPDADTQGGAR